MYVGCDQGYVCMYVPADNVYNYRYRYSYQHFNAASKICIPSRFSESDAAIYTVVGFLSCRGFWRSRRRPPWKLDFGVFTPQTQNRGCPTEVSALSFSLI